ncbi:hypothetical protein RA276_31535, partial [Pseudomonas syringae pv. tagetis]|uniref:hypothetical protein n=1 Tax=Pseudomonas syringae group genomosp. 7 TaxID=251699 RepID=UPI003770595E
AEPTLAVLQPLLERLIAWGQERFGGLSQTQSLGAIADSNIDYRSLALRGNAALDAPRPLFKGPY